MSVYARWTVKLFGLLIAIFLICICVGAQPGAAATIGAQKGSLFISQIYPNPLGPDNEEEWIELYNCTDEVLDLSGVMVGDEETAGGGEGMYVFPDAYQVPAKAFVSIAKSAAGFETLYDAKPDFELVDSDPSVPNLEKISSWATGSMNLGDQGDELLLLTSAGDIIDILVYGSGEYSGYLPHPACLAGQGIARHFDINDSNDCSVMFYIVETPEPGDPAGSDPDIDIPGRLLLSELLPAPVNGTSYEWIEIYNGSDQAIALNGVKLGDEETPGGGEGMYGFPEAAEVPAKACLVVANRASSFFEIYGNNPDFEINESDANVPNMVRYSVWGTGALNLGNSGDEVLMLDSDDNCPDAVCYGSGSIATVIGFENVPEGKSLERYPADGDSDDCRIDFRIQDDPTPGTIPGSDGVDECEGFEVILHGQQGKQGWYKSVLDIEIAEPVTDESPEGRIEYRRNGDAQWMLYEAPFQVSDSGTFSYEARLIDASGNIKCSKSFECKIDSVVPTITMGDYAAETSNRRPLFNFSFNDSTSGIDQDSLQFKLDGVPWHPLVSWGGGSTSVASSADIDVGRHTLSFSVSDKAGLVSEGQIMFEILQTPNTVTTVVVSATGKTEALIDTSLGAAGQPVYYRAFGVPVGVELSFGDNPSVGNQNIALTVEASVKARKGTYLLPVIAMCQGTPEVRFIRLIVI